MIINILRVATFIIFLSATICITWQSILTFLAFLGALLLPSATPNNTSQAKKLKRKEEEEDVLPNVLKGKPRISEKDLPREIISCMEHSVCKFVTYNASISESVTNFACIQNNTECLFAKKAKLWGSPEWKNELNLEENVLRSIPTFLKFTCLCTPLGLDGFVYEIPGVIYGQDIQIFSEAVCRLLTTLSDNDPAGVHCVDKSYIDKRGWVFEFNQVTFFVTTFAPFYPENHSRHAFGASDCYLLLQPEISFAQYDLDDDSVFTDWDHPQSPRQKIRCAFRQSGRGYPIRDAIHYPMAYDIVRPIEYDGDVIQWWTAIINSQDNFRKSSRMRTQSTSI